MTSRRLSLHPWPQRRGEGHPGVRLEKPRQEEVEQHHQFWEAFFGTLQFQGQITTAGRVREMQQWGREKLAVV